MATPPKTDAEGYELEVIGGSKTNTTPNSLRAYADLY